MASPTIEAVDLGIFWRALAVQGLAVALLFAVLLALPLEREFFRAYGAVVGPGAWAACSLVTAAALSLPAARVLLAAAGGGAVGLSAGLVLGHAPGLIASLLMLAAICASRSADAGLEQGIAPSSSDRGAHDA